MSVYLFFFFFKQKTAYEMRISDWSSDVCSSDLPIAHRHRTEGVRGRAVGRIEGVEDALGLTRRTRAEQDGFQIVGARPEAVQPRPRRIIDDHLRQQAFQRSGGRIVVDQDRKSTRLNSSH